MSRHSNQISPNMEVVIKHHIPAFVKEGIQKSQFTTRIGRWMQLASDEAFKSNFHTAKVGCIIVYKNHIVGRGHNQLKTDPKQKRYNNLYREWTKHIEFSKTCGHTIHAEIDALKSISYPISQKMDWKKSEVYIYRIGIGLENYSGLALPCPACANALSDIGIRNVYYTTGKSDKPFGHCDL